MVVFIVFIEKRDIVFSPSDSGCCGSCGCHPSSSGAMSAGELTVPTKLPGVVKPIVAAPPPPPPPPPEDEKLTSEASILLETVGLVPRHQLQEGKNGKK